MKQEKQKQIKDINFNIKQVNKINKYLDDIMVKLEYVRKLVSGSPVKTNFQINTRLAANFIEGIFNGQYMIDSSNKKYLVPENYASKSKLIPGDKLKLVITADGTFIFKQIAPVERKREIGELEVNKGQYFIKTKTKKYKVIKASVVYFKAKSGDKLIILIPAAKESQYAAIENKI